MPHDIIDNRTEKLADHIRTILPGTALARFAVGYFFLSGLEHVADVLDGVSELRLLIGNTTNRETLEQLAEGYRRLERVEDELEAQRYTSRARSSQAAAATEGDIAASAALLDQTDRAEQLILSLVELIAQGKIKVRVYTRGRLHAKAYIFDYGAVQNLRGEIIPREEAGIGIVGSSNLSLAGISSNTELNVLVHGNANHAQLVRWFDALWDESEDFDEHLMRVLRASWALAEVTPYEIYLKTLYELTKDGLEEDVGQLSLWGGDIQEQLADFQRHAVQRAIRMIDRHRGCFVADVVGLGKTYIGAAVLKHFVERERARPLIICPAPLVSMWEEFNEDYDLNARVVSMGMLTEDEVMGPEWMRTDPLYRNRDLVLIDESHNLRHTDNQRYRVLSSYLATDERRCVLLTATPRNSSLWDIHNQIRLFHPAEVTGLPIDPPNLREFFDCVERNERRLPELLSHLLIRRTRQHVLRWYGYDDETDQPVDPEHFEPYRAGRRRAYIKVAGGKQYFPRRELYTVRYSIEETYDGLYGKIKDLLDGDGDALRYARYGLHEYVKPGKGQVEPYRSLSTAGRNLRGLMRVMLFKRLESSVQAFRLTVDRMLESHRAFLLALDHGIVAAGEDASDLLRGAGELTDRELLKALEQVTGQYSVEDFHAEALRHAIAHDVAILERLLELTRPIGPQEDDKLQALLDMLRQPQFQTKCLIFTQFADTADYLYAHVHPEHPDSEVVSSASGSKGEIVARFAPKANRSADRLRGTGAEIRLLVTTDVLSEGLNLQDCNTIINYDLHWNPVRLIQRLGRIDRIGSEHDTIVAHNFLPELGIEEHLGLYDALRNRIAEIHRTIGEDAAILDPDEQLNEDAMYAIYAAGDLGPFEEAEDTDAYVDLHEAEETVRQLREQQPELYQRIVAMPDGVRCGRSCDDGCTYVYCRAGDYRRLVLLDGHGAERTRQTPAVLNWLKCRPDEPAVALPAGHNERVMAIKRDFGDEVARRAAERTRASRRTRAQAYVLDEMRRLYGETHNEQLRQSIDLLVRAFSRPVVRPAVRQALSHLQRDQVVGLELVRALRQIHSQFRLDMDSHLTKAGDGQDDLPVIVCSEGGSAP